MTKKRRSVLKIRNWKKYQHYNGRRNMTWLKLYGSIANDYDFLRLPDASKAHAVMLLVLAMQTDNSIPNDAEFISRRLWLTEPLDLDILVDIGWIEESTETIENIIKISKIPKNGTSTPSDHFSEAPKPRRTKGKNGNASKVLATGASYIKNNQIENKHFSDEKFGSWVGAISDASKTGKTKYSKYQQWKRFKTALGELAEKYPETIDAAMALQISRYERNLSSGFGKGLKSDGIPYLRKLCKSTVADLKRSLPKKPPEPQPSISPRDTLCEHPDNPEWMVNGLGEVFDSFGQLVAP